MRTISLIPLHKHLNNAKPRYSFESTSQLHLALHNHPLCSYVASPSDTLMATLNLRRSVLQLNTATAPPHSAKRLRELARVLRSAQKQGSAAISLRLNTNIELATAKLRAHHKDDCWVGPALEETWKLMAKTSPPQLMVFELWLGEEMIAADFTHPVWTAFGRSVCVVQPLCVPSQCRLTLPPQIRRDALL